MPSQDFDTKAKQFDNNVVLVAELDVGTDADKMLVGVVCVGVKDVHLGQQEKRVRMYLLASRRSIYLKGHLLLSIDTYKAGYLFDLRIHERYQRLGIGKRLSLQAEEECKEVGRKSSYLSSLSKLWARDPPPLLPSSLFSITLLAGVDVLYLTGLASTVSR